jgi:hypothetical protein
LAASSTSPPLLAAASLAGVFSLPPGLRCGVRFAPPRVLVLPLAGFDAGRFGAGSAGEDFAADETSSAVDFDAADLDGDDLAAGLDADFAVDDDFAADALLAADDFADDVRVAAGLAAGAGPVGVTSVSRSSRRKRLPSPAPASTTLRPCSIAVSRMFLGESGMR